MSNIPEPLSVVLRDFLHVEWYEVDELVKIIESGQMKFDAANLKKQLDELFFSDDIPVSEINSLTANEFESSDEARVWIGIIRNKLSGI